MLAKLILIQERNGWADRLMAERLGVARSTWTDMRNGRLSLSAKVQMQAARSFPELREELLGQVGTAAQEGS